MVGFLAGPEYPSRLAAGFPWLDGTAAVHAFREMPGRQGVTGSCLRSVCKPHFVQPGSQVYTRGRHPCSLAWAIISLCSLPETQAERAAPRLCLTLLPTGVAWPSALLRTPVVSCTAFSPSPRWDRKAPVRQSFSVALSDRFLRPGISPASCPAEYGLSSTLH